MGEVLSRSGWYFMSNLVFYFLVILLIMLISAVLHLFDVSLETKGKVVALIYILSAIASLYCVPSLYEYYRGLEKKEKVSKL